MKFSFFAEEKPGQIIEIISKQQDEGWWKVVVNCGSVMWRMLTGQF